jgi:long-chain fatty acid transport protein
MRDMKRILMATAALLAGATNAGAAGFDRSGQPLGFLFEKGDYVELSFGFVAPDVRRVPDAYGDVALDYFQLGLGYKTDLNEKITLGVQFDQPWGARIDYTPTLPIEAKLQSSTINALGRYKFNEAFSVHGGVGVTTIDGFLRLPSTPGRLTFSSDADVNWLVGVAFEKPDIALRVALTYFSGSDHTLASTPAVPAANTINPPATVNLDFQTGIAKDTLLFGQIRWANWTDTAIRVNAIDIVTYRNDRFSYALGIGRRFNENWSGAVTIGYEEPEGGLASALSPTDGYKSIGLAATYTMDNVKITGGVRYIDIGDATASTGAFQNNDGIGVGIRVGYTF